MSRGLPEQGRPVEKVLEELHELRVNDLPTHGGRTLAYVYDSGLTGLDELAAQAHALASAANGLDPTVFPSLLAMENDLVRAACDLLDAPEGAVGTVTSGGTESCLLAVLAAVKARPEVDRPRIVLPTTAHAAFRKAAHYFGLEVATVPVDPESFRADPEAMVDALDERTVLVVVSAPSYAHGVVDPVPPVAAAAAERGIRCHVDACIGGWVLPYLARLGVAVPPFDFGVPGVTSISVDLHKYAYCPKGVSVLLHRDAALRRTQYFASADWPGYTMINSTVQSTRSGGPLAAAWAVLQHIGDDGYLELARRTWHAVRALRAGITETPGLRLLGEPDATLLAVTTTEDAGFDVYTLADEMRLRGWYVQPQFAHGPSPANLHLTVTAANYGGEQRFLDDLAEAIRAADERGPVAVPEQVLATVTALDPDALTPEQFAGLLTAVDLRPDGTGGMPAERMAVVNALLAAASPEVRERLLTEFLGLLQRP
ncbi:MAG TPA: aspartate aminotransferase family protein [Pseudonocardiaceae bacterium]